MCPDVEGPRLARSIVTTVDGNKVFRWVDAESSQVATPADVTAALAGALTIDVQGGGGLREPQRGALFATLAHWTTGRDEPANVVMPTGTGKTEAAPFGRAIEMAHDTPSSRRTRGFGGGIGGGIGRDS